jgi:hypothetical protein
MNLFLEFLDKIRKIGLEYYDKYYSVYPGVVEDTNDPEQRGRIKVSLPSIFGENEPLAQWAYPAGSDLAGKDTGGFFPPYKGEIVDVVFENGSINFPRYMGGFWAQGELPSAFRRGYGSDGPNVRGWVFKSGQKILVDETDGKLKISFLNGKSYMVIDDTAGKEGFYIQHASNAAIQINKDGNITAATPDGALLFMNNKKKEVTVKSPDGSFIKLDDKISLADSSGKQILSITDKAIEITASSQVVLTASTIVLGNHANLGVCIADNLELYLSTLTVPTVLGPSGPPIIQPAVYNASPVTSWKSTHVRVPLNVP